MQPQPFICPVLNLDIGRKGTYEIIAAPILDCKDETLIEAVRAVTTKGSKFCLNMVGAPASVLKYCMGEQAMSFYREVDTHNRKPNRSGDQAPIISDTL